MGLGQEWRSWIRRLGLGLWGMVLLWGIALGTGGCDRYPIRSNDTTDVYSFADGFARVCFGGDRCNFIYR